MVTKLQDELFFEETVLNDMHVGRTFVHFLHFKLKKKKSLNMFGSRIKSVKKKQQMKNEANAMIHLDFNDRPSMSQTCF